MIRSREVGNKRSREFFFSPSRLLNFSTSNTSAFTLIELSAVVAILGLLAAAVLHYGAAVTDTNNVAATNSNLDTVEAALLNFRVANNRLPCPADIKQSENSTVSGVANFGTETSTTIGDGLCNVSGNNNYFNSSGTDPDAAGGTSSNYGGSADPLYDSNSYGYIVGGSVPTKALKLADKYAYDNWGRKILYVVDKRFTATNAFSTYPATAPEHMISGDTCSTGSTCTAGAIVIKPTLVGTTNNSTSITTLANAITYSAAYALVSFGKNGHGGYSRAVTTAPLIYNASSSNADELQNCHCTSSAAAGTFNRVFIQHSKSNSSSGNIIDSFDDIVRFKTRTELAAPGEMQ